MTAKTDYSDNICLLQEYKNGNKKAKEVFIQNNLGLVKSIALRFVGRGVELEDLIEIGTIGLLKAFEGFDENLGYSFSTYAFPLITGEIKRFLRDDGPVKVSRVIKKNAYDISNAKQNFIKKHGREPKISELSLECGLSEESILEALEASSPVISLQEKTGNGEGNLTIEELLRDDSMLDNITDTIALRQAIESLSEFEKKLISLRFFRNLTQNNTAKILGTSQVTVSRTEKKIIDKLRTKIL